jgi:hypothetical protein
MDELDWERLGMILLLVALYELWLHELWQVALPPGV